MEGQKVTNGSDLIAEVFAALGVTDGLPLVSGGQKVVFTGDLAGSRVIVKVIILTGTMADSVTIERAHREVELLAAVDSPHVVKVLSEAVEVGSPPAAVAWVEELLSGQDLSTMLRAGSTWAEEDVWRLMTDVARGLEACHDLRVVHRDLSPGNVRRTDSGSFVVMDPGLARHLERTALTGVFQPGTPGYLSPEHLPGATPTSSSDIFSLGVLAFIALTGRFPVDPGAVDYHARLRVVDVPPIQTLASVSDELGAIIDKCLKRQPARRYLDGTELLDSLQTGATQ